MAYLQALKNGLKANGLEDLNIYYCFLRDSYYIEHDFYLLNPYDPLYRLATKVERGVFKTAAELIEKNSGEGLAAISFDECRSVIEITYHFDTKLIDSTLMDVIECFCEKVQKILDRVINDTLDARM